MRIPVLLVLCLVVCLPLSAAELVSRDPVKIVGRGTIPFAERIELAANEIRAARDIGVRPDVSSERREINLVFPVAGTAGVFSTEGVLVNHVPRTQFVDAFFLPAGGGPTNCHILPLRIELAAETTHYFADFVREIFGQSGFGSVFLFAVRSTGGPDATAQLDGNVRIWAPAPGGGATSQNFPAVTIDTPGETLIAFGLRSDEQYRTNWGIFNTDIREQTFDLTFRGPRGSGQTTVTIPACSLVQDLVPGGPYGSLQIAFRRRDSGGAFHAYGSSVDRTSTDAWSVPARK